MKPYGEGGFTANSRSCEVENFKEIHETDSEKMGERVRSCTKCNNDNDFGHSVVLKIFLIYL